MRRNPLGGVALVCLAAVALDLSVLVAVSAARDAAYPGKDGKIVFVRGGDLWLVDANGSGLTRLTKTSAIEDDPAWSPDGKWIVYVNSRGPQVMRANGSGKRLLLKRTGCSSPDWQALP